MPSPVGHLLAGVTSAWAVEAIPRFRPSLRACFRGASAVPGPTPLVLVCAALALVPDMDVFMAAHRARTHSIGAVGLVAALAAGLARRRAWPVIATALACTVAVGSHLFLDWLGHDGTPPIGLMALWPFSDAYFSSGIDLFGDVSRRYWKPDEFILGNARAVARELALLLPVAALAWIGRRRANLD